MALRNANAGRCTRHQATRRVNWKETGAPTGDSGLADHVPEALQRGLREAQDKLAESHHRVEQAARLAAEG